MLLVLIQPITGQTHGAEVGGERLRERERERESENRERHTHTHTHTQVCIDKRYIKVY